MYAKQEAERLLREIKIKNAKKTVANATRERVTHTAKKKLAAAR
jgi:hypothetical protein